MNYEILKEISETFYINMNDIKCGIVEKSPNIYMRFRTAVEELLIQINKKYNFVPEGEGFYNKIINNHNFQDKMLSGYKCDSKIMSSLNRIKELGNQNTHNTLKVFDVNDVKEILFRLLLLARKVLEKERNIFNSINFSKEDINKEVDSLMNSSNVPQQVTAKEKFIETIYQYDGDLVLLYPAFYKENNQEFLKKYKELISIIINYIISYNPKYSTIEDLQIGEYSSLYKIYRQFDILYNEELESVKVFIYDYTFTIRNLLIKNFNIDILEWILTIPIEQNLTEQDPDTIYTDILNAVNKVTSSDYFSYDLKDSFYVESQRQIVCGTDYYYTIELKAKTINDQSRGNTVYSKIKLPTNYLLDISLKEATVNILGNNQKEHVVVDYRVAIRPAELKWLIYGITGKKVNILSTGKFYTTFMNYLQTNNCSILDILISDNKKYDDFISKFKDLKEEYYNIIKETMDTARNIIKEDEFESGANILRYLTHYLRLKVLKGQLYTREPEKFKNLYFQKGAYRFERNPFSFSLIKHIPKLSTLYECINIKDYQSDILARKFDEERKKLDTLFIDLKKYPENTIELINDYNSSIKDNYNNIGKLSIINNHVYKEEDKNNIIGIINILKNQKIEINKSLKYEIVVDDFLKENNLDSIDKINILKNAFKESKIALILGEAGTGKTELICNYFTNIFDVLNRDNENFSILYIANTHAALNNLKRRVKEKAPNVYRKTIFKTANSLANQFKRYNDNLREKYDLVIMDECKTIPNSNIALILKHLIFDNCILTGDIGQLDAIELGNWFNVVSSILPEDCVFKLTENYRTTNSDLKKVWKLVRENDVNALDYLKENNYVEEITNNIFERTEEHEIILCLNYLGTYGIKAINEYFQNQNPNKPFKNTINTYKVDDPIVFNQNANDYDKYNNYIYNNLTGVIKDIREDLDKIQFTIKVDIFIPINEETKSFVRISNEKEQWSYIDIIVKKSTKDQNDNEDDDNDYVCPFEVTYAMSIHKAQGLEFDSVKIIITPESEEIINNAIFYTAITRAKKKLKIYLTANGQDKIIDILSKNNNNKDVELLKELAHI